MELRLEGLLHQARLDAKRIVALAEAAAAARDAAVEAELVARAAELDARLEADWARREAEVAAAADAEVYRYESVTAARLRGLARLVVDRVLQTDVTP